MNWNYRVVSKETDYGTEYGIREFYYNADGEIFGWTESNETVYGDDVEDIRSSLTWMLEACDKPVISQSELDAIVERYLIEDPKRQGNALARPTQEELDELNEMLLSRWEDDGGGSQG